ncbi:MAG: hypothetical protein SVO01_12090, partial [Thermotogota bacterium]|nr:hypothetical protein [Thermotogota bacterium]
INWEFSHAAALVSTLHPYKAIVNTCIVGSTDAYDALVIPWGSSPITDYLLSSNSFIVLHDGASYDRGQKIFEIRKWETGKNNLRICWQGKRKDKNCGECTKCLRTALHFLASNLNIPDNIPVYDHENQLKRTKIINRADALRWNQVLELAKHNSINEKWVKILSNKLFIYELKQFIKYVLRYKILSPKK